uniref:Uncharacterized protein n=1 Tax=Chrysemys picta bellii TaxID=8478 RepID=A0A8C3HKE9_CHRPI
MKGSDRQDKFVASILIGCQNYLASSEWKCCLVFRYGHVISDFRYSEQWLILPIFMFPVFLLDSPAPAPPWKIIAVILGIFCLILLGVSVALAIKRNHYKYFMWVRYRDSCYYFSNMKKDWNSNYCTSLGSNLLKIDSKEEWVIYFPSFMIPGCGRMAQLLPVTCKCCPVVETIRFRSSTCTFLTYDGSGPLQSILQRYNSSDIQLFSILLSL